MNNTLLSNLVDALHDIVFEIDAQYHIISLNNAWEHHLGYTKDESLGKRMDRFFFYPDFRYIRDIMHRESNQRVINVLLNSADGSLKLCKMTLQPQAFNQGYAGILTIQDNYCEFPSQLRAEAWMVVNAQQEIIACDSAISDSLDFLSDTLVGKTIQQVLKPEGIDQDNFQHVLEDMLNQKKYLFELDFTRPDSSRIKTSIKFIPVLPEQAEGDKLAVVCDITPEERTSLNFVSDRLPQYIPAESSSDILFEVDTSGLITDMHVQKDKQGSLSYHQIVGKAITKLLPPELAETCLSLIRESVEQQVLNTYQYPMLISGLLCWFEIYVFRKSADKAIVLIKDINQVYEVNRKLKESEEKYRLLAENALDVIVLVDTSLNFKYFSPSIERFLGYAMEEVLPMKPRDIITSDTLTVAFDRHRNRKDDDEIIYTETLYIRKDHSLVWGENTTSTLRNAEGTIIGYLINIKDISARKKAEFALKQSEQNLKEAQRTARMGSYEFNYKTQKITWSDELLAILRLNHDMVGNNESAMWQVIHPDDRQRISDALDAYERNPDQESIKEDYRICLPDGEVLYVSGIYKLSRNSQGQPTKAIGIIQDITERKKAEAQIAQQNKELRKLNQELDNLIYSSSHDLRSPLSSALGLLSLIRLEGRQEQKDQYLDLMEKSLRRLDSFTKDILDLYQNARTKPVEEPVEIQRIVEQVLDESRFMENAANIQTVIEIDQPGQFWSESRRLKIIFSNLISNAIRYHNSMQQDPWIKISGVVYEQCAILQIADNGQGIEREHIDKIFQMFYRANSVKKGSGLGLYLVSETIEKLKGSISVCSTYGEGTTFTLTIPGMKK